MSVDFTSSAKIGSNIWYTDIFLAGTKIRCLKSKQASMPHETAGMVKGGGYLPIPGNVVKCLLCISRYSKTLSRPIIYAIFWQSVVAFLGLHPQTLTRTPSLDPTGGLLYPNHLICPLLEKILRAPMLDTALSNMPCHHYYGIHTFDLDLWPLTLITFSAILSYMTNICASFIEIPPLSTEIWCHAN